MVSIVYCLLFLQVAGTRLTDSGLNTISWAWLPIVPTSFTVGFRNLSSFVRSGDNISRPFSDPRLYIDRRHALLRHPVTVIFPHDPVAARPGTDSVGMQCYYLRLSPLEMVSYAAFEHALGQMRAYTSAPCQVAQTGCVIRTIYSRRLSQN